MENYHSRTSPIIPPLQHQILINGQGTMSSKPKHSGLHTAAGEVTLVYTFFEEEYRKGIAPLKNGKAAGIDNVLVNSWIIYVQLFTTGYLICSTNASQKTRYQDCRDRQCSTPYWHHTHRYHFYAICISSMKDWYISSSNY